MVSPHCPYCNEPMIALAHQTVHVGTLLVNCANATVQLVRDRVDADDV